MRSAQLITIFILHIEESSSGILETHTALIYDGIMILAEAIKQLGADQIVPEDIDCDDSSSVWPSGFTLTNFMKSVFWPIPIEIAKEIHSRFLFGWPQIYRVSILDSPETSNSITVDCAATFPSISWNSDGTD